MYCQLLNPLRVKQLAVPTIAQKKKRKEIEEKWHNIKSQFRDLYLQMYINANVRQMPHGFM
jgi:hypothetical protein